MEPLSLSVRDVCLHVVKFGIDIYPPPAIRDERTRLNMFYEAARDRWPKLFDRLVASDTEFRISRGFRRKPDVEGPTSTGDTFVLTNRGPVFVFPLLLPEPVGATGLEATYLDDFAALRELFFSALPDRKILRLGLVRELVFATGQTPCLGLLHTAPAFAGASLQGGNVLFHYRDDKCNVRIALAPAEITKSTQLPVGQRIEQREGYGLQVQLDVNNSDLRRPLEATDIQEVVERATGLWSEPLLEYLNARSQS